MTIRTLVFELPTEDGVQQLLVDIYPDDSVTLAQRPDRYSVWGPPFSPVRDETSGEPTTVRFSNYIEAAQQLLEREEIERRRAGA